MSFQHLAGTAAAAAEAGQEKKHETTYKNDGAANVFVLKHTRRLELKM